MTTEQAIKLMLVEATCIERASNIDHPCTRECENCDLLQKSEDLIAAYSMAVAALRTQLGRENRNPLTLDELQKMDGQPVWCVYPDCDTGGEWFCADGERKDEDAEIH